MIPNADGCNQRVPAIEQADPCVIASGTIKEGGGTDAAVLLSHHQIKQPIHHIHPLPHPLSGAAAALGCCF